MTRTQRPTSSCSEGKDEAKARIVRLAQTGHVFELFFSQQLEEFIIYWFPIYTGLTDER
jgi:hypothetical protein